MTNTSNFERFKSKDRQLATTTENHTLEEMAKQLWLSRADILTANELDMTAAKVRFRM